MDMPVYSYPYWPKSSKGRSISSNDNLKPISLRLSQEDFDLFNEFYKNSNKTQSKIFHDMLNYYLDQFKNDAVDSLKYTFISEYHNRITNEPLKIMSETFKGRFICETNNYKKPADTSCPDFYNRMQKQYGLVSKLSYLVFCSVKVYKLSEGPNKDKYFIGIKVTLKKDENTPYVVANSYRIISDSFDQIIETISPFLNDEACDYIMDHLSDLLPNIDSIDNYEETFVPRQLY